MIVTLTAEYQCVCGKMLKGMQMPNVRVNLHSLRSDGRGLCMVQRCDCAAATPSPADLGWRLDPDSAVKVAAAREKIRARRKARS